MKNRKKLGEIFMENGLITEQTLNRALERSRRQNKKLGLVLEEIEVITDEELVGALALQYGVRVVRDLARYSFPPELLRLIPLETAMQNLMFPLKQEGGKLALAMADPTRSELVQTLEASIGLSVQPFLASRRDILAAITKHYLGRDMAVPAENVVLLVSDSKSVVGAVQGAVTRAGYKLLVAADGMEGYKLAVSHSPRVIITDSDIPKLNGHGLCNALKNLPDTKDIPVLLLLNPGNGEEEARAFERGFYDCVTKPVREVVLLARLKRSIQAWDLTF